ncbi:DNA topoisomerase [Paenibacillus campinasensis]|uniref:DNA topoisomerase n=1 Tax=Paenibacillus campinasensis TaxID=66347 RepID=A0A268EIW7_9BACL|nr:type IA DNA topoisomerase [Paenibacillus campinasensis]PAD73070.1 hypothetical protein CHH67_21055 [Paenibacillus campinasensis]
MRVILAEKPDMGRNIAEALGVAKKERHYITLQSGDVVTWAIGHLIQQQLPDKYPEYKEWKLENLPFVPYPLQLEVDPSKEEQMKVIGDLLSRSTGCVIATDPGREGEHIARTILEYLGYKGQLQRLWIHDLTPETIRTGFGELRPASEYDNLAAAAKIRSAVDFWVGITATRLFSITAKEVAKENVKLSAGRVQTPTLRMVYDREMAIQNFKPETFFVLKAHFQTEQGSYAGQWFKETQDGIVYRFKTKQDAEDILKKVTGKKGQVLHYVSKDVKRAAPMFFDGTALRVAARKELGFDIQKTTKLLQKIYDKKYVTYPRTSSRHLSTNAAHQLVERLKKLQLKTKYGHFFPEEIASLVGKKRFVDDAKATEHHAVVPTERNPDDYKNDPAYQLSPDEEKLYELILKHTLAAFHPEGLDRETEVITEVAGERFLSKSLFVLSPGWREFYNPKDDEKPDDEDRSPIPELHEGLSASLAKGELATGKTSKPKRLSDTDLENLMKYAGRHVDEEQVDADVLQQLKEKGIGTPATRVAIIEKLMRDEYIEVKKNLVYLTAKGQNFLELVYEHPIASVELTGEFEQKLEEVADGRRDPEALLLEFRDFTYEILKYKDQLQSKIAELLGNKALFVHQNEVGSCPLCSKPIVEREKSYSCTGWKEGCSFSIWKIYRQVSISSTQAKHLLAGKEVLLKGIPKKDNDGTYDLFIFLKGSSIEVRFPTSEDFSLGACPRCKQPVLENQYNYRCSQWKAGCTFKLSKDFLGQSIKTSQMKKLLKSGKTDPIEGLSGKKGPFTARLGYDSELNRYCFVR